jgi:hypothetical protein
LASKLVVFRFLRSNNTIFEAETRFSGAKRAKLLSFDAGKREIEATTRDWRVFGLKPAKIGHQHANIGFPAFFFQCGWKFWWEK